ncbi:MAG: hypothetical protein J3K34DRAFT_398787 [Monoraphidium minutum]|nr:MAG: hypothetical protein J3K34DRAFT_398787 [Monoraphidium minutum]
MLLAMDWRRRRRRRTLGPHRYSCSVFLQMLVLVCVTFPRAAGLAGAAPAACLCFSVSLQFVVAASFLSARGCPAYTRM